MPVPFERLRFFSQSPPRCAALLSLFRLPGFCTALHVVCPYPIVFPWTSVFFFSRYPRWTDGSLFKHKLL
jgi:hypothetical protein